MKAYAIKKKLDLNRKSYAKHAHKKKKERKKTEKSILSVSTKC